MIRNYSNTGQTSTLVSSVGATDTSFLLNNYVGDPTPPFTAALARGTATEEVVLVTAVNGSTVTVTRGYDGTSAYAQGAGATFQEVVVALDYREANAHVNASTGVHGVAGSVVGTTDTQTLTNKTLTSPTVSNPTVTGTATVATQTVTGAQTVGGLLTASGGIAIPTGKDVTLTDAPGIGTDAVNKTYADGLFNAPPSPRVIGKHWGSGSAYPVSPSVMDTFIRTDLGPALMRYNGSAWRLVERPEVANYAAAYALPSGSLYVGFEVWDASLGLRYVWTGGNWFQPAGQMVAPQNTGVLIDSNPGGGGQAQPGAGDIGLTSQQIAPVYSATAGPARLLRIAFSGCVASNTNAAGYLKLWLGPGASLSGATYLGGSQVRFHDNGQANAPIMVGAETTIPWDSTTSGKYITASIAADVNGGAWQFVTAVNFKGWFL